MRGGGDSPVLFAEPVHAYASSHQALRALVAGDWHGLLEQLKAMSPPDRGATMRHLAWSDQKIQPPPRNYTDADGRLIAVLQAHVLTVQAWRSRGAGTAETVSEAQWKRFRELLSLAEIILIDVVAHDRSCVDAWDIRLRTARGLELGLSESRRRYAQVALTEPHHLPAQLDLLQVLCPKWHGTWEAAFEFARDASRSSEPGSLQASLLVAAHLEAWVDDGADYLRQQSVIDEVDWAAQRSVLHPDARTGPGWLEAHSMFAQFYSLAQRPAQALPHFEVLGDAPVEALWSYFDEPERQYAIWRRTARAGGGR